MIEVKNITKTFGTVTALKDVSLSVPQRKIFGVLGPNGAGKTTFFSVITGFIIPDRGTVTIMGEESVGKVKGKIGILPQDALFQSNIPIIDQLTFFLKLEGYSASGAEQEVLRVLRMVELDSVLYREAATLSHGMYKRLALAQAFLGSPPIIILDEPTAGLDWRSAVKIRDAIKSLKKEKTILVSSHNMKEMQELCDHVAVLENGTVAAVGPVDEVTGISHSITVTLNRNLNEIEERKCAQLEHLQSFSQIGENTYRLHFNIKAGPEEVDATVARFQKELLEAGITLRSLQEDNRLEELYLQVTDKQEGKDAENKGTSGQ
jgi:ABC-type multidrug transport system ATPase subunit